MQQSLEPDLQLPDDTVCFACHLGWSNDSSGLLLPPRHLPSSPPPTPLASIPSYLLVMTWQVRGLDIRKLDKGQFTQFGRLIDKSFQMPREYQQMTAD